MTDHQPAPACAEGDDVDDLPEVFSERPLRAIQFGSDFITLDDAEAMGISASGPNCLKTLAGALLRAGFSSDRRMLDARGYGDCKCNSWRAAIKEN